MAKTTKTSTESVPAKAVSKPSKASASVKEEAKPKKSVKKVSDDDIRIRAYQIYLESGSKPNNDHNNWLQAQKELSSK